MFYRVLPLFFVLLAANLGSVVAADDELTEREKTVLRDCKKTLRKGSTHDKKGALRQLSDLDREKSEPSRQLALAIAGSLRDKEVEVQVLAAELLLKANKEIASRKLTDALRKLKSKHRGVYRAYIKNVNIFLDKLEYDESKTAGQNYEQIMKLFQQFIDSSAALYEKLETTRKFYHALLDGLVEVRSMEALTTIKEYYRNVSNYSFRDAIPCVEAMLLYGRHTEVGKVITDLEKDYDYAAMQELKTELEDDNDPRAQDFVDWGEEYHRLLTELVERKKLSGAPEFGPGVGKKWLAWWEKNKEKFPYELEFEKK